MERHLLTRRQFGKAGLALLGAAAAGAWTLAACGRARGEPGLLFQLRGRDGYVFDGPPTPGEDLYGSFRLVVTDLSDFTSREVPVPFPAHSIVVDDAHPGLAWLVEKWGQNTCVVDYAAGEVVAREEFPLGRQYVGHGVFSPDGSRLYISEGYFEDGSLDYARGGDRRSGSADVGVGARVRDPR